MQSGKSALSDFRVERSVRTSDKEMCAGRFLFFAVRRWRDEQADE